MKYFNLAIVGVRPFRRMYAWWMKKRGNDQSIMNERERREEDDRQERYLGLDSIGE